MARLNMSPMWLKNVPVPGKGQQDWTDTGYRGGGSLSLRVSYGGSKTWFFMYRHEGRLRRFKLGSYPTVKLGRARALAANQSAEVQSGVDIATARTSQRQADTVGELVETYLDRYAGKNHKDSGDYYRKILEKHVTPFWGNLKPHDLKRRDLGLLLERIDGNVMANRVVSIVRAIFNWAVDSGQIEATPFSRYKHASKERPRDRILTHDEIRTIWNSKSSLQDLWKLLLLTGQRVGEVIKINRRDIDGELWTLPAESTKGNRKHVVPLSKPAREIIEARLKKSEFLFPKKGDSSLPMVAYSRGWSRMIRREGLSKLTPHDCRRTVVTLLPRVSGIDQRRLKRLILNHADNEITAVYDHANYLDEKREALDRWADDLLTIAKGKKPKVVKLQKRRDAA